MSKLYLGATAEGGAPAAWELDADHLVTHGVVVGMTGSGKTGLLTVMIEEALRHEVPVLIVDVKGDLPNLLLSVPSFTPEELAPWLAVPRGLDAAARAAFVAQKLAERTQSLAQWGISPRAVQRYAERVAVRVIHAGTGAGEPLHLLSSLERRSPQWDLDPECARATLSAAISLVLRLLGRDPDPARSREHVLLAVLAERRLAAGDPADLAALLGDLESPPIATVGALPIDRFLSKKARRDLSAALNALLASPSFASWRQGVTLDVGAWMEPVPAGPGASEAQPALRTPATIVSVAHLDDDERALVLGVLLEEVLSWVRGLPGSQSLRALVVFDEVYGFLPPYPAAPPTKRPLVSLLKQARAFGVGVVVATQNPMDLDYRALSNAGLWCIGRLQTDADRTRVVEGLKLAEGNGNGADTDYDALLRQLPPRRFLVRDVHGAGPPRAVTPRWAISLMRGPMTRGEIRLARGVGGEPSPAALSLAGVASGAAPRVTRPGGTSPGGTAPGGTAPGGAPTDRSAELIDQPG